MPKRKSLSPTADERDLLIECIDTELSHRRNDCANRDYPACKYEDFEIPELLDLKKRLQELDV